MHSASWFLGRDVPHSRHQTRGDKQGCSRADDIAASSVGRSPPRRTRKNHQFCARPGAFTSIGSRLNLYCSAGRRRGRRGGGHRSGSGFRGGKGCSSESRRRNIVREGARVASGEPARAIERGEPPLRGSWPFPRSDTLNLGEGHSPSAGCGPSSTTCGSSWVAPSSSSCAREGRRGNVRADASTGAGRTGRKASRKP